MQKPQTGCFSIDLPFTSAAFNHPDSAQDPRFQARYLPFCHGMAAPNMVHIIPKDIVWQCFEYKKSINVRNKPAEGRRRSQTASIEPFFRANLLVIFVKLITNPVWWLSSVRLVRNPMVWGHLPHVPGNCLSWAVASFLEGLQIFIFAIICFWTEGKIFLKKKVRGDWSKSFSRFFKVRFQGNFTVWKYRRLIQNHIYHNKSVLTPSKLP